ncbi:unnamed protein product [Linum trigynum]|uniref:Uncharacterized protein n=1 Tax=Linum trigynum TaxID=586398 RepID=A0AAV2CMN4_9ROSI
MAEDYERSCRKASLGGGGQVDPTAANTAFYAALAVFCVVGGGLCNVAGPRLMLPAGCITYALYAWSFLYYNHSRDQTVIVVAGGMMRSVQGAVLRFASAGVGFLHRGELELGIRWQSEEDTVDGEQSRGEWLIFIFIINFQFWP